MDWFRFKECSLPLIEPLELFCPTGDWTLLWPRLFACASSFEVTLLHMSNIRCVYIIINGKCEALVTFVTFAVAVVVALVAAAVDWWNSYSYSCSYGYVHLLSVVATADEHGHSHRRPYAAYAQSFSFLLLFAAEWIRYFGFLFFVNM